MADEMKKYIVGPMPAKLFLDDFLPTKDIPGYQRREFHPGCYDDAVNAEYEPYAYEPFVSPSKEFSFIFSQLSLLLRTRRRGSTFMTSNSSIRPHSTTAIHNVVFHSR
jgi:hypothetical protein